MSSLSIPDVTGLSARDAALAYAADGWFVGPLRARTKHPGSILGHAWTSQTSRDPAVIKTWFPAGTLRGVFLHVGRSGGVVFDVDKPERLHPMIAQAVKESPPPWQTTRPATPLRRHLVFRVPEGREFGNGLGDLASGWGEVRGRNGVIVVAPSEHEDEDGKYAWGRTGAVPVLPGYLADMLPEAADAADAVSDAEVAAFVDAHDEGTHLGALEVLVRAWRKKVDAGESRHHSLTGHLQGALREAAAGTYPARAALDRFHDAFVDAVTVPGHGEQGEARSLGEAEEEWQGVLAWAVGQAQTADPLATRKRTAEYAPGAADDFDVWEDDEEPDEKGGGVGGSWAPVDLAATVAGLLDGSLTAPEPTIGCFGPGCLFYPGRINSVHGDSTAGKTWTALVTCQQELAKGETVVYVDWEDTAAGVVSRLLGQGVPAEHLARFVYLHPDEPLDSAAAKGLAVLLEERAPSLVVLDSTGEALALEGANPNADEEVAKWFRLLPRLAVRCGAAVLLLDHATKAGDNDLWPIGSQRKRAAVTGAAYLQKVAAPFGKDQDGKAVLVCAKDRHGNYPLRRRVAALQASGGVLSLVAEATRGPARDFRPTGLMEKVSRFLEDQSKPQSQRDVTASVAGKTDAVKAALRQLVADGHVTQTPGARGAHLHASARPYREAEEFTVADEDADLL